MKKVFLCSMFFILFQLTGNSQDAKFIASMNVDSVLMGNYFEVTFTLENAKGSHFQAPAFEGFRVVGGPNHTSSFSMVNGEVSQSVTYSYYLEPKDIGNFYIEPAAIELEDKVLETLPLEVIVLPNPDGIKQSPKTQKRQFDLFDFSTPSPLPQEKNKKQKPKKKRKIYRI